MFLLSEVLDFTLSLVTGFLLEKTFIGRLFVNLLIGKKVQLYNKLAIGGFGLMHGIKNFSDLRGFYPSWPSQRGL